MCWSATASLNTFLFALFGFAIGLANHAFQLPTLVFMMTFSTVQLAEYFIWSNLHDKGRNALASQFLFLVLIIEPYVAAFMISTPHTQKWFLIAYTAFLAMALVFNVKTPIQWHSSPGANGHLQWHAMNNFRVSYALWVLFLIAPLLLAKNYKGLAFGVVSLAISAFYYWKHNTTGTMWCWIATVCWVAVIFTAFKNSKCMLGR